MGTTMFKGLCTKCEKETEFERVTNKETFNVKGELITLEVERSKCKNCGDEVLDPKANPDPFDLVGGNKTAAFDEVVSPVLTP